MFFQAFLNLNPIIRLFQLPPDLVINEIKIYKVSHISATPTFYRMLSGQKGSIKSVVRLTSGGEKFDKKILLYLLKIFPTAKVTNVYASTEAGTLFASEGNEFLIKSEIKDFVKVEHNELFIHKEILGKSSTLVLNGDWYAAGDLIEIVDDNPQKFRFITRKNEMINVGGFKVNPLEVEDELSIIEGVKDANVYSKKNAHLGNIVCCDVVREENSSNMISEKDIRIKLKATLQEFKIPRLIKFVDKFNQTRTGKVKR